jgi:glutamate/tyrosine decarboxylase-like PLP-dependent enzyme
MSLDTRHEAALARATEHSLAFLRTLDDASVAATASLAELRARFAKPMSDEGEDAVRVLDELARGAEGGLIGNAGGRFYGWVIGAGLPAALGADWLTSTWDQNAGLYACGPVAAVVEEVAGEWLKDVLRLPRTASFALVTGCQMAHVTCLAAARYALLKKLGRDVNRDGLAGGPAIRVLTSDAVHGTTTRALKLLGVGTANVTVIATDASMQLSSDALRAELAREPGRPTIVVLQAGDVN